MKSRTEFRPGPAWLMAALLFLFILVNFADKVVLGLLAVPIMDELKFTPTQFGLIGSSFFWLFAIAGVLGGVLADRVRTKWLLFAMALAWSVTQLPIVYGTTVAAFIVARVLLGLGEGPAWPVAVHAIYKWFPDEKRNLPVALFSQGGAIGLLIAGLTVPLISAKFGWRAAFIGLSVFGVVWALVWMIVGREGSISPQDSGDQAGVGDLPLARVIADPTVWGNFVLHFVAYWSLSGALTWLPAYFQKGLGMDNVAAGRTYGLVIALTIPLVMLSSWWSQRMLARGRSSRDARAHLSSLWLIIAGVVFALLVLPGLSAGMRIAIFAIALGFTPLIYALGPAMLAQVTPPGRRGVVIALDNSIASLAGILAPMISGRLIESTPGAAGFESGFLVSGVLLILGGLVGWFVVDPERSITRLSAQAGAAPSTPAAVRTDAA